MTATLEKTGAHTAGRTLVGWQGLRCELPPEWSVTGLSTNRESGTLRVDAPAPSALSAQVRWLDAGARPGSATLFGLIAPRLRRLRGRPEPLLPTPDLKGNLERLFRDTEKAAKKARMPFSSAMKPEAEERGGERAAIDFSWAGEGRGQGRIWFCRACRRVVVAQVVGREKDGKAIGRAAAQLLDTLRCHSEDGHDLWALYDLSVGVPEDFRLESQSLLSGYLNLTFTRGAERLVVERWGLANVTLRRFTPEEWFLSRSLLLLRPDDATEAKAGSEHPASLWTRPLGVGGSLRALREARLNVRRFPRTYAGGVWHCEETNRLFAVQTFAREPGLWGEVASRCACH